jgi:hypothetical protein
VWTSMLALRSCARIRAASLDADGGVSTKAPCDRVAFLCAMPTQPQTAGRQEAVCARACVNRQCGASRWRCCRQWQGLRQGQQPAHVHGGCACWVLAL